ncbi:putative ripening-related protein 2 [Lycium ferocissimum]|uniref:putative ripening-related protein 2 n=1 Tax=Lycium ferocissimum TaxID=112874 RepID=UPI002815E08C|nr:putative ripening-related protein 2 [Lycium ferocissimum]
MKKGTHFSTFHYVAFLIFIIMTFSNTLVVEGQKYNGRMKAILTVNDFSKGGGPSECSGKYYHNSIPIVALSTGWYSKGRRCFDKITIYANGKSTKAMVVDECDTSRGCKHNIVDASEAVWKALGVSQHDPKYGLMHIFWSD